MRASPRPFALILTMAVLTAAAAVLGKNGCRWLDGYPRTYDLIH